MEKNMNNNRITFYYMEEDEATTCGYKEMTAHMIFNVKMDTLFTQKLRFVADFHKVDTSPSMTYTSVV